MLNLSQFSLEPFSSYFCVSLIFPFLLELRHEEYKMPGSPHKDLLKHLLFLQHLQCLNKETFERLQFF